MLPKIIITLFIMIAIGGLGFTLMGSNVFTAVDRAGAAKFVETSRDISQIIEMQRVLNRNAGANPLPASGEPMNYATLNSLLLSYDSIKSALPNDMTSFFVTDDVHKYYLLQGNAAVIDNEGIVSSNIPTMSACAEVNIIMNNVAPETSEENSAFALSNVENDLSNLDLILAGLEGGCVQTLDGELILAYSL